MNIVTGALKVEKYMLTQLDIICCGEKKVSL